MEGKDILRARLLSPIRTNFSGVKMLKCPRCGMDAQPTGKAWRYHVFDVKSYYCKQCDKKFNAYYQKDVFQHTIPKSKKK